MPFCGIVDGRNTGMAVEILEEASRYGGPQFSFNLNMSWSDAQASVQRAGNTAVVIIPFTKTPERVNKFTFIAPLFSHHIRLSTLVHTPPLTSVEGATDLDVGVLRGSAIIPTLSQLGFTKLHTATRAEHVAKLLKSGRIQVQAESQWVDTYHWQLIGEDIRRLQIGPTVGPNLEIYLAGNLSFPKETTIEIQNALNRMRDEGKLEEILKRWR